MYLTNFVLMVLFFGAGAASEKQCLNLKGNYETCGCLQFCSSSGLERGCRNCTDVHSAWCNADPDTFRAKYPECAILCEREKRKKVEAKLEKLSGKIWSLQLTLGIIGGLFSACIIGAVAFKVFRCLRPAKSSSDLENGTATPEMTGCMEKLRSWGRGLRGRGPPVPSQQEDPVQTSRPLMPSAPMPDSTTGAM